MSKDNRQQIYESSGMTDNRVGYGDSPAVVVIDLQRGLTEPDHTPLAADVSDVVENTNEVVKAAHDADVPVVFARVIYKHPDAADGGIFMKKLPGMRRFKAGTETVEIDERLDVQDRDHILDKQQSSVFHETEFNSMLISWGVDTVIVTGVSTSSCVRAACLDACQYGYRAIVPEECVGDRSPQQHESNLWEINAKNGDVRPVDEVIDYLRGIESDKEASTPQT